MRRPAVLLMSDALPSGAPAHGQAMGQIDNADASLRLPRAFARAADCWR